MTAHQQGAGADGHPPRVPASVEDAPIASIAYRCPHCRQPLEPVPGGLACATGHHVDRAAEGYVNLLVAGRKRSRPAGDSIEMIRARRAVFDAGHYAPLIDAVAAMTGTVGSVLDSGCGEGTYLARVDAAERHGIDVSKPAVRLAARRYQGCHFAVASSYDLPFEDSTFDRVLSVFAPRPFGELRRVLRPSGEIVTATPAPEHLSGLVTLLHGEAPSHRPRPHTDPNDAQHPPVARERVRFTLSLSGRDALALLQMTPHWWHASPAQRDALVRADAVETPVDVWVARHVA